MKGVSEQGSKGRREEGARGEGYGRKKHSIKGRLNTKVVSQVLEVIVTTRAHTDRLLQHLWHRDTHKCHQIKKKHCR